MIRQQGPHTRPGLQTPGRLGSTSSCPIFPTLWLLQTTRLLFSAPPPRRAPETPRASLASPHLLLQATCIPFVNRSRLTLDAGASLVAQLVKNPPATRDTWVRSLVGKIPWGRKKLPTAVFWPGESHGLYSQRSHKESDTTERPSPTLGAHVSLPREPTNCFSKATALALP